MKTRLFTTQGCHLCEEALHLLRKLQDSGLPVEVEMVEIADSEALLEQYGLRIPVVKAAHRTDDLGWPFDVKQLRHFLDS